jgi:hypothetical protein
MTSVMRANRSAATVSPGGRRRARALGLGLILALGVSACVEMPPGPAYEPVVSVGVSFYQPTYPNMVLVPGYPVYYSPYGNVNYFFYDGLFWLYQGDRWYSSSWYNGPWNGVASHYVPYYVLQVPVRYYRAPPPYFHGWRADEPPHWGEHWGRDWQDQHRDWNKRAQQPPAAAPLPRYQDAYSGDRYPRDRDQQIAIRDQNYRYEPRDEMTRSHYPPAARPTYQPPPQQPQVQPRPVPATPGWQQPHPEDRSTQPQSEQRPPQYQPPHEERSNQSQVHRPLPTTPPQSQPVPGYKQPTPSTPPQTQPSQQRHRESPPPAPGQPSHPAPQHPQSTPPPPDESSSPPAQGQPKKKSPPLPDKSGEGERR